MQFDQELQPGKLVRRYKRFLADIELSNDKTITVHCPNSGSMLGCSEPGSPVMLSRSDNPKRKYPQTLEMVQVGTVWVGVNTALTNRLVREALEKGVIKEFGKLDAITQEIKTSDKTRLDFLLEQQGKKIFVERVDVDCFVPASHIDPLYAEVLGKAAEAGVMVLAYQADVSPTEIRIARKLPVKIG